MANTFKCFIIVLASLIEGFLTVAALRTGDAALLFLSLPGFICSRFFTGVHGGTAIQEQSAAIAAIGMNMLLVALILFLALFSVPRALKKALR